MLLAESLVAALLLFEILVHVAISIVDGMLESQKIALTELQLMEVDNWVFTLPLLISVSFFVLLFLSLLGERLSYIREIIKGIDALRNGKAGHMVPIERNNELISSGFEAFSASLRTMGQRRCTTGKQQVCYQHQTSRDLTTFL